jgi:hypothetical protein
MRIASLKEKEQTMKNSRLFTYALGVTMAAILLPACSGGSGLAPATTSPTPQDVNDSHARSGAKPLEKLCEPVVYNGVGWQYEPYYNQWWEYSGPWTYGPYGRLVPCVGDVVIHKSGRIFCCPWWGGINAATHWSGVKDSYVVSEATGNAVALVRSTAKATKVLETLSTAPYAAVGVAVSTKGTLYVSIAPSGTPSGGSATSCIVIYPKGSTTPSGMLEDSGMAQSAGAIAVDKAGDVFVSYPVSGSSPSLQIDEFRGGKGTPISFASISGAGVGALATTTKGDVVASAVANGSSTNLINVYNPKGALVEKFSVSGDPTSLSLNKANTQLDVVDSTNNDISVYSFPGGTLVSQSPLGSPSQGWTPASVAQP